MESAAQVATGCRRAMVQALRELIFSPNYLAVTVSPAISSGGTHTWTTQTIVELPVIPKSQASFLYGSTTTFYKVQNMAGQKIIDMGVKRRFALMAYLDKTVPACQTFQYRYRLWRKAQREYRILRHDRCQIRLPYRRAELRRAYV